MGQASARWGDLGTRILSAAVMMPVAIACIVLGGAAFAVMVALISAGMAHEWLRLCGAEPGPPAVLMFASLPLAVLFAAFGHAGIALGLLALVFLISLFRQPPGAHDRVLPVGIPYLGLGAVALIWLRLLPDGQGATVVIGLLAVIWAGDIGAYLIGRLAGGPKLAPRISPGKTWSGAVGGLLAAMAAGAAVGAWAGLPPWPAALLAAVIGAVGQAGDLLESRFKRRFNVKDSGALIPGHGGLLDRLDAVLTAAPAAAILVLVLGRGVIRW